MAAKELIFLSSSRAEERELLDSLFDELFPILRSITGPGLEESIALMGEHMPLRVRSVPSGTQVFDWTVPPEWRLESATLVGPEGETVADASENNLHVVSYSEPVQETMSLEELQEHLHSLPDLPDAVPYVTSYYKRDWGFCLSETAREQLEPGDYRVEIESDFVDGGVPVADVVLEGENRAEILLTSYLCHPSLANNELSGPLVLLALYHRILSWPRRRYTYRFVLHPETIGSLCHLHLEGDHLKDQVSAGLVLTCLGGPAELSYKESRRGDSPLDSLVLNEAQSRGIRTRTFDPTGGSDERQYCSPGFDLPMGQMARTVYGEYEGYHNSLDDKEFMSVDQLISSVDEIESLLWTNEIAGNFTNLSPYGEPQLGKRGLYPNQNSASTRGHSSDDNVDERSFLDRVLTVLNYSDGSHSMLWIAERIGIDVEELRPVVEALEEAELLAFVGGES